MKENEYPTKEQYIKEIIEALADIDTYKVRYFHTFILAKLELMNKKGGVVNE